MIGPMRSPLAARGCGLLVACACLVAMSGCGARRQLAAPVNSDQARQVLQDVLRSWQEGKTPDSWQQASPPVVVQDFDWAQGAKLEQFEMLGQGEARDANLYCQVKLATRADGVLKEKTVTYVVGTDPVLTVFRDLLQ